MKRQRRTTIGILLGLLTSMLALTLQGQEKEVGDVADDFELFDARTGESVRLSDFEGSIVMLDFFFYW